MIAPMVLGGPLNAMAFAAYVEQVLAKEPRPGGLLVLDNLSADTAPQARAALSRCAIEVLGLPPYCPDLNPIETAFSKLKRLARSAAERTAERLWNALGKLLDAFAPTDCANHLRHCGYPATIT